MITRNRIWLEVDLKAIQRNFQSIQAKVAPAKIMPVLKANAYGLGVVHIAKALESSGAERFGLAEIQEAVDLKKKSKKTLQILGDLLPEEMEPAIQMGLVCPGTSLEQIKHLSKLSQKMKKRTKIHFLIDTGMGRLGIPYQEAFQTINAALLLPNLIFEGIYTHFPSANQPKDKINQKQLSEFNALIQTLPPFRWQHMANSDGINNMPHSYFNLVRPGINLYGVFDLKGRKAYSLSPTLALKTRLISKRYLPKGHTVGYGGTYTLKKKTLVGTLPAGYADGIPYAVGNRGFVFMQGKKCKIIGRISMDYTTIDLSPLQNVSLGEEVTLVGKNGDFEQTIEDWAKLRGSHPYEIICGLGPRVERIYI